MTFKHIILLKIPSVRIGFTHLGSERMTTQQQRKVNILYVN